MYPGAGHTRGCWVLVCLYVYMCILAGLCTKDTLSGRAGWEVAGVDMEGEILSPRHATLAAE